MKRTWLTILLAFSLVLTSAPLSDGWVWAESKADKAKKELEEIRKQKKGVQKELESVQKDVEKQKKKLNKLEKQLYTTEKKIGKIEKKMEVLEDQLGKREKLFKNRIRRMYQRGEMGYMTALLESDSLREFLDKFEALRLLVKQDHSVLEGYFNTKREYENRKQELTELQKEQKKSRDQVKEEYDKLAKTMKKHQKELASLEHKEELKEEEIQRITQLTSNTGNFSYGGGAFAWPANSRRINSPYGYRSSGFHYGIDIDGNLGDPIYAAASGVVKENGPASGYGWVIVIDHGSGLTTVYAHMYSNTVQVSTGQRVSKGQRIASIGNNGRSTGPHLHFEVRKNGTPQNPMNYY
ncbi:MAG: murein hydrolase activator EnvC family protein [Planifilum sp.]|jgi:murein DD-endopeptidase MepM/ murein hydrolase activator NlpD